MLKKGALNVQIHSVDIQNAANLKKRVEQLCADERFVHHKWFFKYHLELVEKLVHELCVTHPEANKDVLESLIWFHDLDKILRDQNVTPEAIMTELGYEKKEINELNRLNEIEGSHREVDLTTCEIEVQILSSADGAAHLLGPFFAIYWYENPQKSIEELMNGNREKLKRDWERKIVLPEVKKAFLERKNITTEQNMVLLDKFLL